MRFACDAMCGGLARWLRAMGYDTFYRADVRDRELVDVSLAEQRVLISSDGKLFERKLLRDGVIKSFELPRGLKRQDQLRAVVQRFGLRSRMTRCTACNGELTLCTREEVGDEVPARSLVWATEFYRCESCRKETGGKGRGQRRWPGWLPGWRIQAILRRRWRWWGRLDAETTGDWR